jgi:WD40 repeat protein
VNLHGPVRVDNNADSGSAKITLSFAAWKGVAIGSTTHTLTVLPPRSGPKPEPVSPNLIASLIHPDKKASIWHVEFSPDGERLFTTGYPSGVVQIWDVASRKEVRRVETPRGYRGSAEYAILTPDWKTLYVPVEKRAVRRIERDGKKVNQFDYSGAIRVWDVTSGKEKEPLQPAEGSAPAYAKLAPGGRFLVAVERPSYVAGDGGPKDATVVWDLATGKKSPLCDGFAYPLFAADGKAVVVGLDDYDAKTSTRTSLVKALDFPSGKQRAELHCPDKVRFFSIGAISPNGEVVAVYLGGKKGAPIEVWFRDASTLADRGKLIAKGDPERYGWASGVFTPDGGRFITLDGAGDALVWDVAGQKLQRTLPTGAGRPGWQLTVNPDGKTLAVPWSPRTDPALERDPEPDPRDLPQPRVSLIDLAGDSPPRILVAPHGYPGAVAFSPDSGTLAFGGSGAVHLFDLRK